jgi:IclR family acetate operon transcriptional repressor
LQALDRLVSILELVAASGEPVGAAEVARSMDLPPSTVARLMRQLADAGLLYRTREGRYALGSRVFAIANTAVAGVDLVEAAGPVMRELRDASGETVSLHVLRGTGRVCLAEVQSHHQVRRVVPPGEVQILIGTATGEVLLAGASDAELATVLAHARLSSAGRKALHARLAGVRERGYAITDNFAENLTGISAPITEGQRTVAALTISGPTVRFDREAATAQAEALVSAAATLSPA